MPTFGTDTRKYLPTAFQFSYDGVIRGWGTNNLLGINDVTNQADPIDNKLKISDVEVTLADTDGAIWTILGNGTSAFNKAFSGTVFVGGEMGVVSSDLGDEYKKISETGAWVTPFHTGKITNVSKSNNVVSIRSQNLMNLLPLLEWKFPITTSTAYEYNIGSHFRKYSFATERNEATWGNIITNAAYNKEDNNTKADLYAWASNDSFSGFTQSPGIYDTSQGTGIIDTIPALHNILEDSFHQQYKAIKFKGSYLGILNGTITSDEDAKEHGFTSRGDADTNQTTGATGTFYTINKLRFEWPSGTADSSIGTLRYQAKLRLEGDPTAILRHTLFGKMVTNYYTQDANMGTDTFYEAANITAFKVYNQTLDPANLQVLPYITDLLNTESALFYVSMNNQFNFEPYGPKNLQAVLDEIGTVDIIDSSYENDINDSYNRVILDYGWNFETKLYSKNKEGSSLDWTITTDRPLNLSTQWVQNGNQASSTIRRQLARYKNTAPKASFTTTMKYADMEIGSLVKLTDSNSGFSDKIIQIFDYSKGFGNSNQLQFSGYDGEALFLKKGYARWEGDDDLEAAVSGTSTSGWGATLAGFGTTLGINEDLNGTMFVWW